MGHALHICDTAQIANLHCI